MNPVFLKPGEQLKRYQIYRKKTETDSRGRISYSGEAESIGELIGTVSLYEEKENRLHKRIEHTVSHVIVVQGKCIARAEDVLIRKDIRYLVHEVENPGEIGFFSIVFCEKTREADICT